MTMRPDGTSCIVTGINRSGKGLLVRRAIEKEKRVLVWDTNGELSEQFGYERVTGLANLYDRLYDDETDGCISYQSASAKDFQEFSRMAMTWGKQKPGKFVIEELANVTSSAKAKEYWHALVSQSLKYGNDLYAIAQRPQEVDNTILGNAKLWHIAQVSNNTDAEYIKKKTDIPLELIPREELQWLQYRTGRGLVAKGFITFGKPSKNWPRGVPQFKLDKEPGKRGQAKTLKVGRGGFFEGVNY